MRAMRGQTACRRFADSAARANYERLFSGEIEQLTIVEQWLSPFFVGWVVATGEFRE
jgi:hypothetical protein